MRTQAEKLKKILQHGTLHFEGHSEDSKINLSFTPTEMGIEAGIPPMTMTVFSPYELIDVIMFEFLEKRRK